MEKKVLEEMGRSYPKFGPNLDIKFKASGIRSLKQLYVCGKNGSVQFKDESLVIVIIESGNWDCQQDRIIKTRFPSGTMWKDPFFLDQISLGIESISLSKR